MMHDREKSDSAIVAAKPTNKAAANAAEPVEPRAEAKGNASQQSTHRAQDRESVSQALERVRQAARQRKKERFTALLHHINIASLRMAFFALKRDAVPGAARGGSWSAIASRGAAGMISTKAVSRTASTSATSPLQRGDNQ